MLVVASRAQTAPPIVVCPNGNSYQVRSAPPPPYAGWQTKPLCSMVTMLLGNDKELRNSIGMRNGARGWNLGEVHAGTGAPPSRAADLIMSNALRAIRTK